MERFSEMSKISRIPNKYFALAAVVVVAVALIAVEMRYSIKTQSTLYADWKEQELFEKCDFGVEWLVDNAVVSYKENLLCGAAVLGNKPNGDPTRLGAIGKIKRVSMEILDRHVILNGVAHHSELREIFQGMLDQKMTYNLVVEPGAEVASSENQTEKIDELIGVAEALINFRQDPKRAPRIRATRSSAERTRIWFEASLVGS